MKEWIPTSQIEPADLEGTVSGRSGSNIMFVWFSKLTGWWWVYPRGMKEIGEPPLLLLDPQWARLHPRKSPIIHTEKPKSGQLTLGL